MTYEKITGSCISKQYLSVFQSRLHIYVVQTLVTLKMSQQLLKPTNGGLVVITKFIGKGRGV